MEIGPVAKPAPSNVGPISRIVPAATAPVAVQMPSVAVEQATRPPPPRPDPQPKASALARPDGPVTETRRAPRTDPDAMDRRITIDPATQQVIYQAIDKTSGEVVRQIPEEAMLRLQVYARAMRQADAEPGLEVELKA